MNRWKVKFRRWWNHQDDPHILQMNSSNARYMFLLDQYHASIKAEDVEQGYRLLGLIESEERHFNRVMNNAMKSL